VYLQNKDVLVFDFDRNTNRLRVTAGEPLLIENRALGYLLTYDLTKFEYDTLNHAFIYGGFPFFKELEPRNAAVQARWLKNREEAYKGSMLHFMRSLYAGDLGNAGFEVRRKMVLSGEEKARVKNIALSQTGNAGAFNTYNVCGLAQLFQTRNP
jgi:hypothetical protein